MLETTAFTKRSGRLLTCMFGAKAFVFFGLVWVTFSFHLYLKAPLIENPLIIVHYHKSGDFLSNSLISGLQFCYDFTLEYDKHCKRASAPCYISYPPDIHTITAPFSWPQWVNVTTNNQKARRDNVGLLVLTNYLHLVRDPLELVISGYLYHRIASEHWLQDSYQLHHAHFCPNPSVLGFERLQFEYAQFQSGLELAQAHCIALLRWNFDSDVPISYQAILNAVNQSTGVWLEAYRALFADSRANGGDILRMISMIRDEQKDTIRLYLDHFNQDPASYVKNIARIFKVDCYSQLLWSTTKNTQFSTHVTKNQIDSKNRSDIIASLLLDIYLGPILRFARVKIGDPAINA
jgi:hypothetical protein